ncbi:hypothetical protein BSFA1_80850 (plasmid) [Burkholderia sp. SFA1]|nr:hypothetical protein BSFA1_80850 [Burkholderia sp. SFA1]
MHTKNPRARDIYGRPLRPQGGAFHNGTSRGLRGKKAAFAATVDPSRARCTKQQLIGCYAGEVNDSRSCDADIAEPRGRDPHDDAPRRPRRSGEIAGRVLTASKRARSLGSTLRLEINNQQVAIDARNHASQQRRFLDRHAKLRVGKLMEDHFNRSAHVKPGGNMKPTLLAE